MWYWKVSEKVKPQTDRLMADLGFLDVSGCGRQQLYTHLDVRNEAQ